MLSVSNLLRR
uniref:Uncharacterized protein n=1 Tax=Anguilla anguilla TaxID=7936 RepID=A0A0E9T9W6_ANGAN